MNVSDTLNLAADLIEERGWVKGEGWQWSDTDDRSPLCLEGGIMAAMGMRFPVTEGEKSGGEWHFQPLFTCPAYRAVVNHVDHEPPFVSDSGDGFEGQPLYWWNDAQQSPAQVIEVLRATAVIEAAREARERQAVSA